MVSIQPSPIIGQLQTVQRSKFNVQGVIFNVQ